MRNIKTKNKADLRKEILQIRNSLNLDEIKSLSTIIEDKVISINEYNSAKSILLYSNIRTEVNTNTIFLKSISNKHVYYPRVQGELMDFYKVNSLADLQEGYQGILEPKDTCVKYDSKLDCSKDIIIIPGSVFSKEGYRIGYGKGYYDKFLQNIDIIKIGICYDFQLIDYVPYNQYDIRLDMIITDKTVIKF